MKKHMTIILALSLVACGGKKIQDQGPSFRVSSAELTLNDINGSVLNLKRSTIVDSGPTLLINSMAPQEVVKVYKELQCGPLNMLGKTSTAPDPELFTIKFSDTTFSGLKDLPQHTQCSLNVTLENKAGSTSQSHLVLKINFDTNPPLNVSIMRRIRGLNSLTTNRLIELERITVANNFKYPVGFSYFLGKLTCNVRAAYTQDSNRSSCSGRDVISLSPSQFTVSGVYSTVENDPSTHISILIQPGEQATIIGYASVPEKYPLTKTASSLVGGAAFDVTLTGVSIGECTESASHSIAMFHDFQFSKADVVSPNLITAISGTTLNYPVLGPLCDPSFF